MHVDFSSSCVGAFYEGHMESYNVRKESILLTEEETGEENVSIGLFVGDPTESSNPLDIDTTARRS